MITDSKTIKFKKTIKILFALTLILWSNSDRIIKCSPFDDRGNIKDMSMKEFSDLAISSAYEDRFVASDNIFRAPNFDTSEAFVIIIKGMAAEVDSPLSPTLPFIRGGITPGWDNIMNNYLNDLVRLGPSILPCLDLVSDTSSGNLRNWLLIVRGLLGDGTIADELRILAFQNADANIREDAIRALSKFASINDFEIYRNALQDTYKVIIHTDIDFGNGFHEVYYPVRGEAINALQELGFSVKDSSGQYLIRKK